MARRTRFDSSQAICHWCGNSAADSEWRSTIRDINEEHSEFPFNSGWVICGPGCPDVPSDSTAFRRRPPVSTWGQYTPDELEAKLYGAL